MSVRIAVQMDPLESIGKSGVLWTHRDIDPDDVAWAETSPEDRDRDPKSL